MGVSICLKGSHIRAIYNNSAAAMKLAGAVPSNAHGKGSDGSGATKNCKVTDLDGSGPTKNGKVTDLVGMLITLLNDVLMVTADLFGFTCLHHENFSLGLVTTGSLSCPVKKVMSPHHQCGEEERICGRRQMQFVGNHKFWLRRSSVVLHCCLSARVCHMPFCATCHYIVVCLCACLLHLPSPDVVFFWLQYFLSILVVFFHK